MKENIGLIPRSKDYLMNKNKSNRRPDIIQQVDKVIIKYKNQLEQLKQKKDSNEMNMQLYPPTDRSKNKYSKYSEDTECYLNQVYKNLEDKNNLYKTEKNNDYIYEGIKEEKKDYNDSNENFYKYKVCQYNKSRNYNTIDECNKMDEFNDLYKKFNVNNNFDNEIKNDNMKLGSALTLEKGKVIQLLNLLKMKEGEIDHLKRQIDNFDTKINEIENKYQKIICELEKQQSNNLNNIYNNVSNEKNKLKIDYDEIKKNTELKLEQINIELKKNQKIIKLFFDLFNRNIDLYDKTDIISGEKSLFINNENNFTEENAFLAVETMDKLINKLVQDNRDLFNELIRLNGEIKNNNLMINQNNNYIQQENNSLRQLVNDLTNENKYLKSNRSFSNLRAIPNNNNYYRLSKKSSQYNNNEEIYNNSIRQIPKPTCRNCSADCYKNNRSNRNNRSNGEDASFERLKLKINELENQIKNQKYSYE